MKDSTKSWEIKRQQGKLKYVLIKAIYVGSYALVGIIFGSLFFYSSPSTYSFSYYLPTYIYMFFGVYLIAAPIFIYQWNKNEAKHSELLDINARKLQKP